MFWNIFLFELRYRLKRPATWIYFGVTFLLGFLFFVTGNTPAPEKVFHNSPYALMLFNFAFSMILLLVVSAVMGVPLYRDLEHGTRHYLYSYPISESSYFWGRFWGSFLIMLVIGSALIFGPWLGSLLGPVLGIEPADRYAATGFGSYVTSWLKFSVPNFFIAACVFFALVSLTKNQRVLYAGGVVMLITYLVSSIFIENIDDHSLIKYVDAFGLMFASLKTRYWTPVERNTLSLAFSGEFLWNRLLFVGLAFALLMFAHFRFAFSRFHIGTGSKKLKAKKGRDVAPAAMPYLKPAFDSLSKRRNFFSLVKIEFLNVLRDNYFRVILLAGILFLVVDFVYGFRHYNVKSLPVTTEILDIKKFNYALFNFIIIVFFTGEMLHRERTHRFNIINDALPISNRMLLLSKLAAMVLICFLLSCVPIVAGVSFQTVKGFFDYNFPAWFTDSWLISFPNYVVMMLLCFAIHLLIANKWAAHGVAAGIYMLMWALRGFAEMDFNPLFYSYTPQYMWSDMNGIGHFLKPQLWFNFYWMALGLLLVVLASLFFVRGIPGSFKERLRVAKSRFSPRMVMLSILLLITFLASGSYIYYNTNILNKYVSITEDRKQKVQFEKTLKKYEFAPQPKITDIQFETDVYPDERRVETHSIWKIANKSGVPIDTLHISATSTMKYTLTYNGVAIPYTSPLVYEHSAFTFFKPGKDTFNFRLYKLPQTLLPGDSAVIDIRAVNAYYGFVNKGFGRDVVHNGTFTNSDKNMPYFGYDRGGELESDKYRVKYGLAKKTDDYPPASDSAARERALFTPNADYIKFRAILSVPEDQIAVAPGYVQKTWEKNGRRYYEFYQDEPILDFYAFMTGRFKVTKDTAHVPDGRIINLEIYHHPSHNYNLSRFLASYKDGLRYFGERYGPFQFRQMRAIEFPRYAGFAQSFANTVPFSESFGWTANFSSPDDFDYIYWITAHELAHQWFGHQVTPSLTLGANMISESMAEFTALQLAEWKYGRDNLQRFLKEELDFYLNGRAMETRFEHTLIDANKPYIWYNKGGLVLYAIEDLIGHDTMVKAIREYIEPFAKRQGPPYSTSHDLYSALFKYTPDSLKYFLVDSWKKITLYENKTVSATSKPVGNDMYEVTLKVRAGKQYADSTGKETKASMNDYIDIGVFAAESKDKNGARKTNPIYLQKHKLTGGAHTITVKVKGKPVKAGIDPYNKLIDRVPDDNVMDL